MVPLPKLTIQKDLKLHLQNWWMLVVGPNILMILRPNRMNFQTIQNLHNQRNLG